MLVSVCFLCHWVRTCVCATVCLCARLLVLGALSASETALLPDRLGLQCRPQDGLYPPSTLLPAQRSGYSEATGCGTQDCGAALAQWLPPRWATRCIVAERSACSYGTWKGYFGFQEFSYK